MDKKMLLLLNIEVTNDTINALKRKDYLTSEDIEVIIQLQASISYLINELLNEKEAA